MKHLFVPYELALKLKEKGFDGPCLALVVIKKEVINPQEDLFGNTKQLKKHLN